jgi:tetratricopeptide (TPR) repeat protein
MDEDEDKSIPDQASSKLLTWILALAVTLVAGAIAWVGWNCIDSLQKHTGKLKNYHSTAENTKIDTNLNDELTKKVDVPVLSEHVEPDLAIQDAISKPEGSELYMNKGGMASDKGQYSQAVTYFTQVLAMIPGEAKNKTSWRTGLSNRDKTSYTEYAYEQRAFCYLQMRQYAPAIADLTAAIKLQPDNAQAYQNRAKAYHFLGDKVHEAADVKILQGLSTRNPLHR